MFAVFWNPLERSRHLATITKNQNKEDRELRKKEERKEIR